MEAFAAASPEIPEWSLRLVGSMEEEFEGYVAQFFERHPHLRQRVVFTGKISDKTELKKEYQRAKIFAITSTLEGGTPNVFAEAAGFGCYMVCSEIDAAGEFTDWGNCGMTFETGSIEDRVVSDRYENGSNRYKHFVNELKNTLLDLKFCDEGDKEYFRKKVLEDADKLENILRIYTFMV